LSYVDQMAVVPYMANIDVEDEYEPYDAVAGY